MPLEDLSGKTVYGLDPEDFEELFCRRCCEDEQCPKDEKVTLSCKAFVDSGLRDMFLEKRNPVLRRGS